MLKFKDQHPSYDRQHRATAELYYIVNAAADGGNVETRLLVRPILGLLCRVSVCVIYAVSENTHGPLHGRSRNANNLDYGQ